MVTSTPSHILFLSAEQQSYQAVETEGPEASHNTYWSHTGVGCTDVLPALSFHQSSEGSPGF